MHPPCCPGSPVGPLPPGAGGGVSEESRRSKSLFVFSNSTRTSWPHRVSVTCVTCPENSTSFWIETCYPGGQALCSRAWLVCQPSRKHRVSGFLRRTSRRVCTPLFPNRTSLAAVGEPSRPSFWGLRGVGLAPALEIERFQIE